MRLPLLVILCFTLVQTIAQQPTQVEILFPHPELIKPNTVIFSPNKQYVAVCDEDYIYGNFTFSLYTTHNPTLISSKQLVINDIEDLRFSSLTNDGRYISLVKFEDSDTARVVAYYSVDLDSLIMGEPKENIFPPDSRIHYVEEYWESNGYRITFDQGSVHIQDTLTGDTRTLPQEELDLTDDSEQHVQVSEDGSHIAVMGNMLGAKITIRIWDINSGKKLWESPRFKWRHGDEFLLMNDHVIVCTSVDPSDKGTHLKWYDYVGGQVLFDSESATFVAITGVNQSDHVLSLYLGDAKKQGFRGRAMVDLRTGAYRNIPRGEKGVMKLYQRVEDSLMAIDSERIEYVQTNRQYSYRWYHLYYDHYDSSGNQLDTAKKCQLAPEFFDGVDNLDLSYVIYHALDNKATYQNNSNDMAFFGLTFMKKHVHFWNGNLPDADKRKVHMLYSTSGFPFFYTEDMYYFGHPDLKDIIRFRSGSKTYTFEQFDLKFNRPDIVLQRLGYADTSLIRAYHRAYVKRLEKMGFTEDMLDGELAVPVLELRGDLPTLTESDTLSLAISAQDASHELDRLLVWINDVPVYGMDGISLRDNHSMSYEGTLPLKLAKGKNKVQVSVMNAAGAESIKETFEVICSAGKSQPDLYLVTIGASKYQQSEYDLTYPAKDASDVVDLFSKGSKYGQVHIRTLVNQEVTLENIQKLDEFLKQADINDEVMVFVAGHGVLDQNLDYYLASHDMDFQDPASRGIPYTMLEGLMDKIAPLTKTLILDACHGGELDKDDVELAQADQTLEGDIHFRAVGPTVQPRLGMENLATLAQDLFADLRKGTGTTVIASSGGMEYAMESDKWNNGLFSYCMLHGVTSMEADLDQNGEIWLSELQDYLSQKVSELSHGQQRPTARMTNHAVDFRVW